jgi:hypothetical protein
MLIKAGGGRGDNNHKACTRPGGYIGKLIKLYITDDKGKIQDVIVNYYPVKKIEEIEFKEAKRISGFLNAD